MAEVAADDGVAVPSLRGNTSDGRTSRAAWRCYPVTDTPNVGTE
jgi:hypothetical protein